MRKLDAPNARKGSARPSLGVLILFGWKYVHHAQVRSGSFWRRICWWLISLNWIVQIYTFTNILKGAWATPPSTSITPFSTQSEPTAVILSSSLNKLKTLWQQQVLLFGAFAKSACLLNKTYFANRYWIIVNILHFAKKFGLWNLFFSCIWSGSDAILWFVFSVFCMNPNATFIFILILMQKYIHQSHNMRSINSIVQQKNIAPHIHLGVDNAARVKSYLIWLPFVGLSPRCLFLPLVRLQKKWIMWLVLPAEFRPQRLFTREKCGAWRF